MWAGLAWGAEAMGGGESRHLGGGRRRGQEGSGQEWFQTAVGTRGVGSTRDSCREARARPRAPW